MIKIIANWKMYLTIQQSRELSAQVRTWWEKASCSEAEIVICPSDIALRDVADQLSGSSIKVGGQEISLSDTLGAFTGQTPAQQLKEAGAQYVLIGHSEQRSLLHLNDKMIRQQVMNASKHRLQPILCLGETKEERDHGRTDAVLMEQLHKALEGLAWPTTGLTIAYEPRWAIGTGKPVDPLEAARVNQVIRHTLQEFFGHLRAQDASILYGGSVDADNFGAFIEQEGINGFLIGSASTKPEQLKKIVERFITDYCKE